MQILQQNYDMAAVDLFNSIAQNKPLLALGALNTGEFQ